MKKIKESRFLSFPTIILVYAVTGLVGVLVYRALSWHFALKLLVADIAATAVCFVFSLVFSNASVYDPYWSVQPPFILAAFIIANGISPSALILLLAVSFWGIRLTANWAYTFGNLTHQDWRYTMLKNTTGKFYPVINFVGIHLVPTLVVYACTLPAVYIILEAPKPNILFVIFACLSVFATLMQAIADIEMQSFRKEKRQGFIRAGLWKYSRHPNYLAEILMWWGVALSSFSLLPNRPYLLLGAILNTLLFTFVSIPMAEKRQSRKDGFALYKSETRVLLPLPKKIK